MSALQDAEDAALSRLRAGAVIPAHPLALDSRRRLDERRQRALTRYYIAAGAGGGAVGRLTPDETDRELLSSASWFLSCVMVSCMSVITATF